MGSTLASRGAIHFQATHICPYVRVTISNGLIEAAKTALLDGGSEATLITEPLASMLSLKGKRTNIRLRTFHGIDPSTCVRKTTFKINSFDGITSLAVKCAYIVEDLNMAPRIIDWQHEKGFSNHLANLPLENFNSHEVGILIGVNVPEALVQSAIKRQAEEDGTLAILTPFGWTVMGPVTLQATQTKPFLPKKIREETSSGQPSAWLTNVFATSGERKEFICCQEEEAWRILRSSIRLVNGHYELLLLWKNKAPDLPDNRNSALKSFYANEARSLRDPDYKKLFIELMDVYENQGFSRRLLPSKLLGIKGKTWYLKTFILYHPRTRKPPMVFDASRNIKGRCLNDELQTKPNLLLPLRTVLLRFRKYLIAVNMGYQEGVPSSRRKARGSLRFTIYLQDAGLIKSSNDI